MRISVKEAAGLLDISEKTIYRWVAQGKIPCCQINDQYRFNRAELLEWATAQRIPVSPRILEEPAEEGPLPRLEEALRAGGIFYRVAGNDKESVLKNIVEIMPLPDDVDRDFLFQVLISRESVGSTGMGGGIAIPHVRNPIVMHIPRPMVSLCFLEKPVEFGAIDGKPVHTLFTIVSPTIRAHLALISRICFGLHKSPFVDAILREALRDEILLLARELDEKVVRESETGRGGGA